MADLCAILCRACSSDSREIKQAEAQLSQLRRSPGFFDALVRYGVDSEKDGGSRVQALLYVKNAVASDWRSVISAEEKECIRGQLLTGLNEPSDMLSVHILVLIASIGRIDCPHKWPNLVPSLIQNLQQSPLHSTIHRRTLHALFLLVKALASKRLAIDVRKFKELTSVVYTPIFKLLESHLQFSSGNNAVSDVEKCIVCATLCIKCLRYLTLYGLSDVGSSPQFAMFMDALPQIMHKLFQISGLCNNLASHARETVSNGAAQIMKFLCMYMDVRPTDLTPWMQTLLQMAHWCAFDDTVLSEINCDKLTIRSLTFLRQCLMCIELQTLQIRDSDSPPTPLDTFFDNSRIESTLHALVHTHLPLTENDLSLWDSDPEQFILNESDVDKCTDVKSAAQCLVGAVVHRFWESSKPLVHQLSAHILSTNIDIEDQTKVFTIDSMLCMLGLCTSDYYDCIDMNGIFGQVVMSPSLWSSQADCPYGAVVRRRVLWLCAQWLGVKFDEQLRSPFYQLITSVLSSENCDVVVQMAAVDALTYAVDDFEFKQEQLVGYVGGVVPGLLGVMDKCCEDDNKMVVMRCVSLLVERMGTNLGTHVFSILRSLSEMWNTNHNLLKGQMLVLLTHLVNDLGTNTLQLIDAMCDILRSVLDPQGPQHVFLIEDGLDLWQAVVSNSPSPSPVPLVQLVEFLPQLLTVQSENLKVVLEIVRTYLVMQDEALDSRLAQLLPLLEKLLSELRQEGAAAVIGLVEWYISTRRTLLPVSLLEWCINTMLTQGNDVSLALQLKCMSVWSRTIVYHPQARFDSQLGSPSSVILCCHCKMLLQCSHNSTRQKLGLMALYSCIATLHESEYCLMSDAMYSVVECVHNLCVEGKDVLVDDQQPPVFTDTQSSLLGSAHDHRIARLMQIDAVYSVSCSHGLIQSLSACRAHVGTDNFMQLWLSVDLEVRQSLHNFCDLSIVLS